MDSLYRPVLASHILILLKNDSKPMQFPIRSFADFFTIVVWMIVVYRLYVLFHFYLVCSAPVFISAIYWLLNICHYILSIVIKTVLLFLTYLSIQTREFAKGHRT